VKTSLQNILLATLLALLSACVTTAKVDWDARVGSYTFDAAVKELGPPDKSATLTDGSLVTEWLAMRGNRTPSYHSFPDGRVLRIDSAAGPDSWLRLTFAADGKLREWKRVWR
jgi:hypothetical protein